MIIIHFLLCLVNAGIHLFIVARTDKRHSWPAINIVTHRRHIITYSSANWFCSHLGAFLFIHMRLLFFVLHNYNVSLPAKIIINYKMTKITTEKVAYLDIFLYLCT